MEGGGREAFGGGCEGASCKVWYWGYGGLGFGGMVARGWAVCYPLVLACCLFCGLSLPLLLMVFTERLPWNEYRSSGRDNLFCG